MPCAHHAKPAVVFCLGLGVGQGLIRHLSLDKTLLSIWCFVDVRVKLHGFLSVCGLNFLVRSRFRHTQDFIMRLYKQEKTTRLVLRSL